MKKIFYLGYYDTPENKNENRNMVLSATNKMTYIVSAMESAGYSVNVVSASQTCNKQKYDGKVVDLCKNSKLVLFKTLPWGNKIRRVFSVLYSKYQLIKYILKNVGKDDTLVVYHSIAYADIVRFLKKIIKFKLVLEVEEIYSDVSHSKRDSNAEFKIFECADAYIFSTGLLDEKVNKKNKPYSVIYGTYQVENDYNCKFNDDRIHVVYAGTFDPRKGGAQASLSAVPYLNEKYHMHILGFGSADDTKNVTDEIERLSKKCKCKVTYDGLLSGEEYIKFIQSCHIGMSTQNPDGGYNDTSFPSKILSYMANGLYVVSVKIPVVEKSAIGTLMHFYNKNNGKMIADVISDIKIDSHYNSRKVIKDLDEKFVKDLMRLLKVE